MQGTKSNKLIPYLYILPIMLVSGVFLYYSIGFLIFGSFQKWNGIGWKMTFVGLNNYKELLNDKIFWNSLLHNLIYFVVLLTIQTVLGMLMAVLLKAKLFGHTFFKALYFMPSILAAVIIAGIFRIMMDTNTGAINTMFQSLGLDFLAVSWLGDPKYALLSIIIVAAFEWTGFSMVLYYAGLMAIPEDLYESALIDGAGFWTTLVKITVPMLRGTTTTNLVFGITGCLKTFDIVNLLTNGGPGNSTQFLNTWLYNNYMKYFKGGYASAMGVFILVLSLLISAIQIKMYERSQRDM